MNQRRLRPRFRKRVGTGWARNGHGAQKKRGPRVQAPDFLGGDEEDRCHSAWEEREREASASRGHRAGYAHLLDVALFAAMRKKLERQLSIRRLAALLGVSEQHVTVLRGRSAENSKSELLPQRALSRAQTLLDLVAPEFGKFAPISVGRRSYLRNVARALRERHVGSSPQQVESRFGFQARDVERWYGAAIRIASVKGVKGGQIRRRQRGPFAGLVFGSELTTEEWDCADQIQSRLCELLSGPQKDAVVPMLRMALTQGAGGHSDLWFTKAETAREFLGFVQQLGVTEKRVRFLHHPREPEDAEQWRLDRIGWAEAIGVSVDDVLQASIKTSHRTSQSGVLGIQIAAADEVIQLMRAHHTDKEQVPESPDDRPSPASPMRIYGSGGFWVGIRFGAIMSDW